EQLEGQVEVAVDRGDEQRARVVAFADLVDVGARSEQRTHRLRVALARGEKQRRQPALAADQLPVRERLWLLRATRAVGGLARFRSRCTVAALGALLRAVGGLSFGAPATALFVRLRLSRALLALPLEVAERGHARVARTLKCAIP